MLRRLTILFSAILLCLTTVAAVADALVVTDEERLEDLAAHFSEGESDRRLDNALRYFAPEREAVDFSSARLRSRFGDHEEVELAETIRTHLAFVEQENVESIQRSVSIEGPNAVVAMRLSSGGDLHDLTLHLRRHEDRWLVRRLQVR